MKSKRKVKNHKVKENVVKMFKINARWKFNKFMSEKRILDKSCTMFKINLVNEDRILKSKLDLTYLYRLRFASC